MPEEIIHTEADSLRILLRGKERQLWELQKRADAADTILQNAILSAKPRWKSAVSKAHAALNTFD